MPFHNFFKIKASVVCFTGRIHVLLCTHDIPRDMHASEPLRRVRGWRSIATAIVVVAATITGVLVCYYLEAMHRAVAELGVYRPSVSLHSGGRVEIRDGVVVARPVRLGRSWCTLFRLKLHPTFNSENTTIATYVKVLEHPRERSTTQSAYGRGGRYRQARPPSGAASALLSRSAPLKDSAKVPKHSFLRARASFPYRYTPRNARRMPLPATSAPPVLLRLYRHGLEHHGNYRRA